MANSLNQDLKGKTVLIKKEYVNDSVTDRRFKCEDGFGCSSFTSGGKIFGHWLSDGEKDCIRGEIMIESLVE